MPRRRSGESSDADKAPFMYYLQWDSSRKSCEADDFWKSEYVTARKCPRGNGCGGIRPRYYGESMIVPLTRRPSMSLGGTYLCGVVHNRLLTAVQQYMVSAVYGWCVVGKSAKRSDEFSTYYSPMSQSLHVLYGPHTRPQRCRVCGNTIYPQGTVGDVGYVLRQHIRGRHAHVEGGNGSMLITPWLAKRIDIWMLCKDIQLIEYPVLDEPLGLLPKQGAGPTDTEVAKWKPGEFLWRHPRAAKTVPPLPARRC